MPKPNERLYWRALAFLVRIRWQGFARTSHWLRGLALLDYCLREDYLPVIAAQLNQESPLLARVRGAHWPAFGVLTI